MYKAFHKSIFESYKDTIDVNIMPDDSRNNPNSHLALFAKPCHRKSHIVFLPESSVIIARVDHCIDTVRQADADYTFTNISYLASIFTLDVAFLQVIMACIWGHVLDVCLNNNFLQAVAAHVQDFLKNLASNGKPLMGISNPVSDKVPSHD